MRPISTLLLILVALACVVNRPSENGPRVFEADFEATIRGITQYCRSSGFAAEIIGNSVVTDWKSPENLGFPVHLPNRSKMSFALKRLSDSQTLVVSNIRIEHHDSTGWTEFVLGWQESRELTGRVFDQIKHYIR